jgi:hypothetical protein
LSTPPQPPSGNCGSVDCASPIHLHSKATAKTTPTTTTQTTTMTMAMTRTASHCRRGHLYHADARLRRTAVS